MRQEIDRIFCYCAKKKHNHDLLAYYQHMSNHLRQQGVKTMKKKTVVSTLYCSPRCGQPNGEMGTGYHASENVPLPDRALDVVTLSEAPRWRKIQNNTEYLKVRGV